MRRLKNVFEDATNIDPRALVRVQAEWAVAKVERANIVQSENVIGVAVCDQDRVEMLQAMTQSLLAKVGGSIDDDCLAAVLDQNRDAQTFDTRIVGDACLAIAGGRGDFRREA